MKAYLCREFGPISSHKIEEIEIPKPQDNDVLIEVYAAGVAFPDVLVVQGLYQIKPDFPFSPGGEFAGVIKSIGSKVKGWKEGDRVIGFKGSGVFPNMPYAINTILCLSRIQWIILQAQYFP